MYGLDCRLFCDTVQGACPNHFEDAIGMALYGMIFPFLLVTLIFSKWEKELTDGACKYDYYYWKYLKEMVCLILIEETFLNLPGCCHLD
jgi:hypothetical protein